MAQIEKRHQITIKNSNQNLQNNFDQIFKDYMQEQDRLRIRGYREISTYTKGFFQEWLDGNAIASFNLTVNKKSSLPNDWVNLMNIASQMKFYSVSTVSKMTTFLKQKWIYSSVRHPDPNLDAAVSE